MQLRAAAPGDFAAIQAIYHHHVLHGLASFEEAPPDVEELRRRHADIVARGLPYLVADEAGAILGYGYCAPYRLRSAYRYALEDSVYVKDGLLGRGIGSRLLGELIRICEGLGYRQLIAVIGDSANARSIALHARLGFLRVGTLRSAGYKFGRWVDSVIMQRPLASGDGTPPAT
ncbi:MAG: GNAT family N-acetyltransferase [Betaproteobacteria bacterium]|nr:GNAT family N-acetyltransferase [Betaproteobacteria bacterium]MDH5221660.1 GNAT family N-acetyltransferase [Betaproteobacteria bacterium]MDH5351899.1 GNAT family N-acetyltransferase [Betaproteobacteria bacterium]